MVEGQNAEPEDEERRPHADPPCDHVMGPRSQEGETEHLDDRGEGIDVENDFPMLGDFGKWVDHRGGVHEDPDAESDELLEVSVFRRQGRDKDADAHAEEGQLDD